ncbi:unnamed protein product [Ambrosiozyma monospora]|uniref:Unnamed protein product n=1 Tax=Ambrosiozyma monospora TaxID=43982 RepID=A0ACB5T7D4_AMBMO|nr:unnamed protein product [Ambrosiozyma monospora]
MSSWDTSISVFSYYLDPYSSLYMLAKCSAMIEDGSKYGHWYDEYFMSSFDEDECDKIQYMYAVMKNDFTKEVSGLPILDGAYAIANCPQFVTLLDDMPWKERVLASAKSRFLSYSSAFTTPIYIESQLTVLNPKNYGNKKLSGGAIAGIAVGCGVLVAMVVAVTVVFVCLKKRSKLNEGAKVDDSETRRALHKS